MSLFRTLFRAVQTWRRRRGGGPKTLRRSSVTMERLDHRQLLSVTFTGNPITDIPNSTAAGTVIVNQITDPNSPSRNITPTIPANLSATNPNTGRPYVPVSGFEISALRLNYDAQNDTLNVAIQQPDSQLGNNKQVIAGDADDNGNGATVDPDVTDPTLGMQPQFRDFASLGGSEYMAISLDLLNNGTTDVVAGIAPSSDQVGKLYQVSQAVVNPNAPGGTRPGFGASLSQFTGGAFLQDTNPNAPGFEFAINHFSQLYLQETGQALSPTTTIGVGAFAGSADDFIGEEFFPAQPVVLGVVPPVTPAPAPTPPVTPPAPPTPPTVPVTPPTPTPNPVVCPPQSPPIVINPHKNGHIDTAHPTDVRVTVLGSERLPVDNIVQTSLRLGGAAPLYSFDLNANHDSFRDRTFVFRGSDINLPAGRTLAELTGSYNDGTLIDSYYRVTNKTQASYSPAAINAQAARQAAQGFNATNPPLTPTQRHYLAAHHQLSQAIDSIKADEAFTAKSTVKVKTRVPIAPSSLKSPMAKQESSDTVSMTAKTVAIPSRGTKAGSGDTTVKIPTTSTVAVATSRTKTLSRSGMNRAARAVAVS